MSRVTRLSDIDKKALASIAAVRNELRAIHGPRYEQFRREVTSIFGDEEEACPLSRDEQIYLNSMLDYPEDLPEEPEDLPKELEKEKN